MLVRRRAPAAVDVEGDPGAARVRGGPAKCAQQRRVEPGDGRRAGIEDRHSGGHDTVVLAQSSLLVLRQTIRQPRCRGTVRPSGRRRRGWHCIHRNIRHNPDATARAGRSSLDEVPGEDGTDDDCRDARDDPWTAERRSTSLDVQHAPSKPFPVLPGRMRFPICRRNVPPGTIARVRVLIVEDEPLMAEAIRDGLRLEAIAADIAYDGDAAIELLDVNMYDIAVLDRDIPGPSGDEIAQRIVASDTGMPILMLTAADRLDDKATGFALGADDYLTKPFDLRELVLRLRALDRRRAHHRPPVREIAGLRVDPFRREVYRDGRFVPLTRKQFAVLEVLVAAQGGVVSAEELLEQAWDGNADPFTNAVRITVSALRKRLGEPWVIVTVPGAGYRIEAPVGPEAGDHE